ncbi:MAG: hypothetical protein K2F99_09020 [Muribaculaceae bacterium]|nr:hypothetical protein [Bacteroidales bacterium]MDE6041702.1 hypothetical protein [Muribaculaceae bacterium]
MKKLILGCLVAALALSGCDNAKKEEEARRQEAINQATREELATAVSDRDQLLDLVNEINEGMTQIRQMENILASPNSGETVSQRDQLKANIAAIQQTLRERREKLADLEKRLSSSNVSNSKLQATITSLRTQLDEQTAEIQNLTTSLNDAKARIGQLDVAVDSLNTTVANVTAAKDSTATANTTLTNELNTCYYAIGSKGELKDNGLISTGFLRKTKLDLTDGSYNSSFFTKADKRTLTVIDLNSDKAKVMTSHPDGSYNLAENNGHKVLQITNPAAFWSLSNYLVVQID